MKRSAKIIRTGIIATAVIGLWLSMQGVSAAHCDTLDGPVVVTAKTALEKGDITPVLKWIRKEDEKQIREQFDKTLAVRKQGKEARELADMYFFETLVRIHRAGEGAPYTGLKAAGTVEPSVAAADRVLATGSDADLIKMITDAAGKGIHQRFAQAREAQRHADESVEKGREFVKAYVEFTHYVERLHIDAAAGAAHQHEEPKPGAEERHHHH